MVGTIEYVEVDSITVSGINPIKRTDIKASDELLVSMRKHGYIEFYPILLSADGKVGDGHRRLECAKMLGIDSVPVLRTDKTVEELIAYNAGAKTFRTIEWDTVSFSKVEVSSDVARWHKLLDDIAGPSALALVSEYGKSSRISAYLRSMLLYIGKIGDKEYGLNALRWMLANNQQRAIIDAMKDSVSPSIILDAISNNRRLTRGSWTVE